MKPDQSQRLSEHLIGHTLLLPQVFLVPLVIRPILTLLLPPSPPLLPPLFPLLLLLLRVFPPGGEEGVAPVGCVVDAHPGCNQTHLQWTHKHTLKFDLQFGLAAFNHHQI